MLKIVDKKEGTTEDITKILNDFTKPDIVSNFLSNVDSNIKKFKYIKKVKLVELASKNLMEKFTNVYELELYLHSKKLLISKLPIRWTFYQLKNGERFSKGNLTAVQVSDSFRKYFKLYEIPCETWAENIGNCIWIAVYFGKPLIKIPSYVVLHLKLSAVFLSDWEIPNSLYLEKIIERTLKKTKLIQVCDIHQSTKIILRLTHSSLDTLLKKKDTKNVLKERTAKKREKRNVDKCESKRGKKDYSADKKRQTLERCVIGNNEVKSVNILDSERETKMISETVSMDYDQSCVSVFNRLNNSGNSERKNGTKESDDSLPEIKKLTYYVQSRYFGDELVDDGNSSACIVELTGENVLKGLKHLVESGVAESPLPPYLWEMPIDGQTTFHMNV